MNYTNLCKLMYTPLTQYKKSFSCFYPKEWILDYITEEKFPEGLKQRLAEHGWSKKVIVHCLENSHINNYLISLLKHDIFYLRMLFSKWVFKDPEKIKIVLKRINYYLIFELDYDNWIRPENNLLETPENLLESYELTVEEAGIDQHELYKFV